MKSIAILGSTGSIGTQALELVSLHPERYRVAALTARLGPAKEELDAAETLWLELSMR